MPLPALYKTAAQVTLADKSYTGTGIGVITPGKGTNPCPDDQTRNNPHTALRSPTQRANTILKHLKAPQHATLNPQTTTHTTTTTPIITNPNKHTQRKRLCVGGVGTAGVVVIILCVGSTGHISLDSVFA
ncbi:hypothetical protein [Actinomyces trachealis]|uniref:hypothetical protein n=1 Tax=Actinomyces trachealis TaxID=2763540 RepID=UPI0018C6D24C|nr:hypothetical protein [Actinomyces trachealis]